MFPLTALPLKGTYQTIRGRLIIPRAQAQNQVEHEPSWLNREEPTLQEVPGTEDCASCSHMPTVDADATRPQNGSSHFRC
ncbi:hypothetical protein BD626DRAFT_498003 [Schizophyllum amplum]|uniref:Uncharacterized protein n=1 Tax=Schizophyllum amplum TaxID=97359 RepID=A0A550CCV6_9AGAR|nr:hypothetical protein BD626DRAFT_498003 [Auriculariopsis ampla]